MGAVFQVVGGADRASLQSQGMALVLEEGALQQRKTKDKFGMGAEGAYARGFQTLFRGLQEQSAKCLRSLLLDAEKSRMRMLRRLSESRTARSLGSVTRNR